MLRKRPNYIIYAPEYTEDIGGVIFLHRLAHELNDIGESAFIWPFDRKSWRDRLHSVYRKPSLIWKHPVFRKPSLIWKHRKPVIEPDFATAPDLKTPVARDKDLKRNSIVVYPEITLGNPLNARNVVRWLLYRPGLRFPYKFGKDEMFFRTDEFSDIPELTGGAPQLFLLTINSTYRNENRRNRKGACFIVRKGKGKTPIKETEGAVRIDGMSHEDIAEIFNSCEIFYSYDEATFYSQYAAICGCLSVVVPGLFGSRAEWVNAHPIARYGVAYGLDDLEHARSTGHRVMDMLREAELKGLQTVQRFVELTQKRFASPS